jgi:hypothetical protein
MTVAELRNILERLPGDMPVVIWDDNSGRHGDAAYTTSTDGELTICGRLEER